MAVNKELWQPVIMEQVFADNDFLNYAVNADEYVVGGSLVHIPQAGTPVAAERNGTNYPLTVRRRADTDVVYLLDEYRTAEAFHIVDRDKKELSYDKMASEVRQNMGNLKDLVAADVLYKWAANAITAAKFATSGAGEPTTLAGATGNRKAIKAADLAKCMQFLDEKNVPKSGRYMIVTPEQHRQLLEDDKLANYFSFSNTRGLEAGVLANLYGFNIMTRSSVLRLNSTFAPKLPEAAAASTDVGSAIFYQRDHVERALGTVEIFETLKDALYQGDLYSFLVRMGARARRADAHGVGFLMSVPV